MPHVFNIVIILTTVFINVVLGILVWTQNPRAWINRIFSLVSFGYGFWAACLLFYDVGFIFSRVFWVQITYVVATILEILTLAFSFTFPKPIFRQLWKWATGISVLVLGLTFWLLFCTKFWIQEVIIHSGVGVEVVFGPAYTWWLVVVWAIVIWALGNFIANRHHSTTMQKMQLRYLYYGIGISGILVSIPDVLFPLFFHDTRFFAVSSFASLVFTLSVSYAIIRHRFFDIRLLAFRSVTYTLLVGMVAFFFASSLFLVRTYIMREPISFTNLTVITAFTLVIAFSFQTFKTYFEQVTDHLLFKGEYRKDQLLKVLALTMASTIDLHHLTRSLLKIVCSHMHIQKGVFIVFRNGEPFVVRSLHDDIHPYITLRDEELLLLKDVQGMVVTDELTEGRLKEVLRREMFSLLLPLVHEKEAIGFLLLGEKLSGDVFFEKEIGVLEILIPEFALALHNALQVEEIRMFNDTLKDEVDKATKDLRKANEHLLELDTLKDEFVAIASHQMRTPMTVIKGHLYLALTRDETMSEKTRKRISVSLRSTEELIRLVNDMLDISRIEGGRIELLPIAVDIKELSELVLGEMEVVATKKNIALTVVGDQPVMVTVDPQKIKQVITNIIDNALKYSKSGASITVSFAEKADTIIVSIADTGIGIAPHDIPKLFSKFGRLDSSLSAIPEAPGTGLGLYICKKIVEMSQGKIWASSVLGKGSTFLFSLPKAV